MRLFHRDHADSDIDLVLEQHASGPNPLDPDFDYSEAFASLDVEELKRDVIAIMTDSRNGGPPTTATTARSLSA